MQSSPNHLTSFKKAVVHLFDIVATANSIQNIIYYSNRTIITNLHDAAPYFQSVWSGQTFYYLKQSGCTTFGNLVEHCSFPGESWRSRTETPIKYPIKSKNWKSQEKLLQMKLKGHYYKKSSARAWSKIKMTLKFKGRILNLHSTVSNLSRHLIWNHLSLRASMVWNFSSFKVFNAFLQQRIRFSSWNRSKVCVKKSSYALLKYSNHLLRGTPPILWFWGKALVFWRMH